MPDAATTCIAPPIVTALIPEDCTVNATRLTANNPADTGASESGGVKVNEGTELDGFVNPENPWDPPGKAAGMNHLPCTTNHEPSAVYYKP